MSSFGSAVRLRILVPALVCRVKEEPIVRCTSLLYKVRGIRERNLIRAGADIISNTEPVLYGW